MRFAVTKKQRVLILIAAVILLLACFWPEISSGIQGDHSAVSMKYSEFYEHLEQGDVASAVWGDGTLYFTMKDDSQEYQTGNPGTSELMNELYQKDVEVTQSTSAGSLAAEGLDLAFDLLFFGIIAYGLYRVVRHQRQTFRVVRHTKVSFDDIAGMDELKEKMLRQVDVLKNPEKYRSRGIRPAKGIILEGPPGNGKTYFAKALANEAHVNFIATKGADFQSAMMSIGSRNIRSLFRKAARHRPCIIFIDEFDGIGERRNYAGTGVDKENNRIITAMLNEMDGFSSSDGILVIGATNSFDSLDSALIRPGRFDLKFRIDNPDAETREELVRIYTKNRKLDPSLSSERLAEIFAGLSCSAIETVLNEAAMDAMQEEKQQITLTHLVDAARCMQIRLRA